MTASRRMNAPRHIDAPEPSTMFPHTVTLYTTRTEVNPATFREETTNYITILRGVLLDASKAANVRASGLEGADAVNLYVPFGVDATDGLTGEKKQYIGPVEFWRLEDKSGCWTLTTGQETWFVKGVALPPDGMDPGKVYDYINLMFDDVYNVTKVDIKDFGGLQHFEFGGA